MKLTLTLLASSLVATACAPEADLPGVRGPIGKADLAGSCLSACNSQSAGNCWCDESCAEHGDCCGDFVNACEPEGTGVGVFQMHQTMLNCESGIDCTRSIELDGNGRLSVNELGEPARANEFREATVSASDFAEAWEVLNKNAFVNLLRELTLVTECGGLGGSLEQRQHEMMLFRTEFGVFEAPAVSTFGCDIPVINDARETALALADKYLPPTFRSFRWTKRDRCRGAECELGMEFEETLQVLSDGNVHLARETFINGSSQGTQIADAVLSDAERAKTIQTFGSPRLAQLLDTSEENCDRFFPQGLHPESMKITFATSTHELGIVNDCNGQAFINSRIFIRDLFERHLP